MKHCIATQQQQTLLGLRVIEKKKKTTFRQCMFESSNIVNVQFIHSESDRHLN